MSELVRAGPSVFPAARAQQCDERPFEFLGVDIVTLNDLAARIARLVVEKAARFSLASPQLFAQLAILRVGDQTAAQTLLNLLRRLRLVVDELGRNGGQERARFQKDQGGGDHEILRRDFDVERLHRAHVA